MTPPLGGARCGFFRTGHFFARKSAGFRHPEDVIPSFGASMLRSLAKSVAAVCVGFLLTLGDACAGWITISNDTNQTLVVQESVTVNGQVRRCKPLKLAPGETVREFRMAGGTKSLTVSETGLLGKQLFAGDLTWKDDTAFSIHKDADKVKITDVATLQAKKTAPANQDAKKTDDKKPR